MKSSDEEILNKKKPVRKKVASPLNTPYAIPERDVARGLDVDPATDPARDPARESPAKRGKRYPDGESESDRAQTTTPARTPTRSPAYSPKFGTKQSDFHIVEDRNSSPPNAPARRPVRKKGAVRLDNPNARSERDLARGPDVDPATDPARDPAREPVPKRGRVPAKYPDGESALDQVNITTSTRPPVRGPSDSPTGTNKENVSHAKKDRSQLPTGASERHLDGEPERNAKVNKKSPTIKSPQVLAKETVLDTSRTPVTENEADLVKSLERYPIAESTIQHPKAAAKKTPPRERVGGTDIAKDSTRKPAAGSEKQSNRVRETDTAAGRAANVETDHEEPRAKATKHTSAKKRLDDPTRNPVQTGEVATAPDADHDRERVTATHRTPPREPGVYSEKPRPKKSPKKPLKTPAKAPAEESTTSLRSEPVSDHERTSIQSALPVRVPVKSPDRTARLQPVVKTQSKERVRIYSQDGLRPISEEDIQQAGKRGTEVMGQIRMPLELAMSAVKRSSDGAAQKAAKHRPMRLQRPSIVSSTSSAKESRSKEAAPLDEWEADEEELMRWTTEARSRDVEEAQRRQAMLEARANMEYDPFAHRPAAILSSWAVAMHLVNGMLGLGLFLMPFCFTLVGVALGVVGLLVLSAISCYCLNMGMRNEYAICREVREPWLGLPRSVEYACRHGPRCLRATAPAFRYFVYFISLTRSFFITAAYSFIIGEFLHNIALRHFGEMDVRLHILVTLPFLLALCLVTNMTSLLYISIMANVLTAVGVGLLLYVVWEQTKDKEDPPIVAATMHPLHFAMFVGSTLYSINNVPLVQCCERYMRDPRSMLALCGVLTRTIIVMAAALLVVGTVGYMRYGSDARPKIYYNFLPSTMMEATEATFIVAWCLSYPINNFVMYDLIWELNLKGMMRGYPKSKQTLASFGVRLALVLISTTLAVALPEFLVCEAFAHSLTVPLLVLGFPAMIELCLCWEVRDFGRFHYALIRDLLMVAFALYCTVCGIVQTFLAFATGEIDKF